MTSETERIVDQLEREYGGDAWHGSPLSALLERVTADRAAARAVPGAHTIWEIVLHMTGWKNEVRRRLSGAPAGEPQGGDWPAVTDRAESSWRDAIRALESAQAELIAAIRQMPEAKLYEATNDPRNAPLGTGVSYYVMLHGIVQHDVYHSGQIALLAKAS